MPKVGREDLIKAIQRIRIAYNNAAFVTTKEQFNVWFDFTSKMELWTFKPAVDECISNCKFLPTVADLKAAYHEVEEYQGKIKLLIHQEYERGSEGFPKKETEPGMDFKKSKQLFVSLTIEATEGDIDKALVWAKALANKSRREYNQMLENPETIKNFPSYWEYLQNVKDNLKK